MITADKLCECARDCPHIGEPYEKLDCQALVETLMKEAGVKYVNWRGSNHMWRDALVWKGSIDEAVDTLNGVPPGALVFTVKQDGGEKDRGYNDNEGNASHVGLYIGDNIVIHSTPPKVTYDVLTNRKRWTHCGLYKYVDYGNGEMDRQYNIQKLRVMLKEMEELLNALE